MLYLKGTFSKFQRAGILLKIFSDCKAIKLNVNYKMLKKNKVAWKLKIRITKNY